MPSSPPNRPNVLLVVLDDMGFSDLEPFGGEIRTPVLQQLAGDGLMVRGFHVSSLCAPTRSMLLSGVDNHQNGLGTMPPMHSTNQYLQPGYEGPLNKRVMTIAEVLKGHGYHTYIAGKWHLGAIDGYRPEDRGFDRVLSFLGGGASHFSDHRALSSSELPHRWTPARSTPTLKMSELRASACAVSTPPYDSPQMPMRFGSTSGRDCRYLPPASTS